MDFRFKTINVDDKTGKFQIWDTAGHERFHSINSAYFRGCDGAILCYDVSRLNTFRNIPYHLEQVQEKGEKNSAKILVATKCDLQELREVSFVDGIQLSQQLNVAFLELSAKENRHVEEAFEELGRQCIANKKIQDKLKYDQEQEFKQLENKRLSHKISFQQIKRAMKTNGCC